MRPIAAISQQIWDMKYRFKTPDGAPIDKSIEDTWMRVATALAACEADAETWQARFYEALDGFKFIPAGRIVAGAGTARSVTLFNCFVMGTVPDDMGGIFAHLREAALTMQQGGGIGYDFSTLRPKGAAVKGVGADASGPLTFMDVWDAMCRTIMSAGSRRGAMMATLRCDHPDIEAFIEAKREPGRLRMFNLSVLVSDAFMVAVKEDAPWQLVFGGTHYKTVRARELWEKIMRATYAYAEPGVIFIDRINRTNNLWYAENISATNPCGEQPLPPYGACLLGSLNLAAFVSDPFGPEARLDEAELLRIVPLAVRMMDNVTDVSRFPLPEQQAEAHAKRRIGLGVTGLADALAMCKLRYGTDAAVAATERWMRLIQDAAYGASVELAREKGPFPLFDRDKYLAGPTVQGLGEELRAGIAAHGIRNALLTSIAPTGTISLMADNVSSGLEPIFSYSYMRTVLMPDGTRRQEEVSDYAYRLYKRLNGDNAELPGYFVDAQRLSPSEHVVMQAAVQKYVDASISKTINCPEDIDFEAFKDIYAQAYALGCKGCTTYRPNDVTGSVLTVKKDDKKKLAPVQQTLPLGKAQPRAADPFEAGGVVYMTRPLDRPEALPGQTYKIKWAEAEHALYITINDVINDGRRRPFEVFINSKNTEHYAWTVALTRMISAVFRRGGDVSFVVEELKAVFDPRGGQWMNGRYVPSLLAAIGEVIERHMIQIGFLRAGEALVADPMAEQMPAVAVVAHELAPPSQATSAVANLFAQTMSSGSTNAGPQRLPGARTCPKCQAPTLIRQEGCDSCSSCGYSKCG
jgi:ribonucleoside-diphosphate reductase alpha chain